MLPIWPGATTRPEERVGLRARVRRWRRRREMSACAEAGARRVAERTALDTWLVGQALREALEDQRRRQRTGDLAGGAEDRGSEPIDGAERRHHSVAALREGLDRSGAAPGLASDETWRRTPHRVVGDAEGGQTTGLGW